MDTKKTIQQQISNTSALALMAPLLAILAVLVLFVFIVPSSYAKITNGLETFKEEKQSEDILRNKLEVLQNAPPTLLNQSTQAVTALPHQNPALILLSQIKEAASANNVAITSIKSNNTTEVDNQINRIEITLRLEADDFLSITNLITELSKKAPISTIDLVTLTGQKDSTKTVEFRFSVYWADLPQTLPAITDPLTAFTSEELMVLERISSLAQPQFSELQGEVGTTRENPFN